MIALYALPDNARITEEPVSKSSPIKPNKRNIYLASLLLGLILPPGIFTPRKPSDEKSLANKT